MWVTSGTTSAGWLSIDTYCQGIVGRSRCSSCGEDHEATLFDWRGQCSRSRAKFYEKVRRLYWHRQVKNKE